MKLKNLPIVLGFFTILITIPAAVFLLSDQQKTVVTAEKNGSASVYLWPQKFNAPLREDVTVEIKIDTKGKSAKRAEMMLNYDPQYITVKPNSIGAAEGVSLVQNVVNSKQGTIQLSGTGNFNGQENFAQFTISAKSSGSTNISISNAHVWDSTESIDLFGQSTGSNITIE